jgi:DNA-binding CsgD family transcriptional regulator
LKNILKSLKGYKLELTPKQPFNIPLSTDKEGVPDFCFVRDRLNVERIIYPLLERLNSENGATTYINLIRNQLENITSSYGKNITKMNYKLTPREIELCNMIKSGLSSKDISKVSNISIKTVDKHRRNIRQKLDISNRKVNLTSLLRDL